MTLKLNSNTVRLLKGNFRISLAVFICLAAPKILLIDHGGWAVLTIMFVYFMPTQGLVMRRALERVLGTLLGIFASILFVSLLIHSDYKWLYVLPVVITVGITILVTKGHYAIGLFLVTVVILSIVIISQPFEVSLYQVAAERGFYTVLACCIVVILEVLVFPGTSRSQTKATETPKQLCAYYADILVKHVNAFIIEQSNPIKFYQDRLQNLTTQNEIETHYYNEYYALSTTKMSRTDYRTLSTFFNALDIAMNKLFNITAHSQSIKMSPLTKKLLLDTCQILANAINRCVPYLEKQIPPTSDYKANVELLLNNNIFTDSPAIELVLIKQTLLDIVCAIDHFYNKYATVAQPVDLHPPRT